MKHDIRNKDDLKVLVDRFYEKICKDDVLGPFFNEVVQVDWDRYLPLLYDFWENVLFYTGNYSGNPMEVHRNLHQKYRLQLRYFTRWNMLFNSMVDELFEGENANAIKHKAQTMSTIIQLKIFST